MIRNTNRVRSGKKNMSSETTTMISDDTFAYQSPFPSLNLSNRCSNLSRALSPKIANESTGFCLEGPLPAPYESAIFSCYDRERKSAPSRGCTRCGGAAHSILRRGRFWPTVLFWYSEHYNCEYVCLEDYNLKYLYLMYNILTYYKPAYVLCLYFMPKQYG